MSRTLIAQRYAKALFDLAIENHAEDLVLQQLRVISEVFEKEPVISDFFSSPLTSQLQKQECLTKALPYSKLHTITLNFLNLLAEKNRFDLVPLIVRATQDLTDEKHGVCRGFVKSASALDPEERAAIEKQLKKVIQKQVVMSYQVDPSLIGGLVAQVGSYTLDDSLTSHLNRLNDQITRSI